MPSELDLRRFYDRSPVGFYRSTLQGRFVFASPYVAKILGYAHPDELMALDLTKDVYFEPSERAELVERYRQAGVVDGVRVRWRQKNGAPVTVRIFGFVVQEPGGVVFDATLIDVTEQEAAEAALAVKAQELNATTSKLQMFLQQMPVLFWTVDAHLVITSSDGAIAQMLGHAPGLNIGRKLTAYFNTEDPAHPAIARHHDALRGLVSTFDYEHAGKTYTTTIAPQRNARGDIVGAMGMAVDVTAARQLERRLVDAQRAESLGVLAGGLAHDFNNLLVAVLGNADLALRDTTAAMPARDAIENVRDAALRAAELTQQLLAYAGRGEVAHHEIALGPIVDELVRILQPSIPPHVRVVVEIPPVLPRMVADARAVRQVMMNLIANARDALQERGGTIVVTAQVATETASANGDALAVPSPGAYLQIDVRDDGLGMAPEVKRRIFDPFFTTKESGHGLGLASVLGLVRSHNGGIRVASEPGRGTTFTILWPVRGEGRPITQPPAATAVPLARVLVVDDDEMVRDVLARMLDDLGYEATCAAGGSAGVAAAQNTAFDVAFIDLTMPGLAGPPLVAALRAARPKMPIVVCSGFDRDHKGPMVVDGYLSKPFRLADLEAELVRVLAQRVP